MSSDARDGLPLMLAHSVQLLNFAVKGLVIDSDICFTVYWDSTRPKTSNEKVVAGLFLPQTRQQKI
jgi:hypothetical protein